jgi:hypothetical protein
MGTFDIDLFSPLRRIRENEHAIVTDFQETATNRQVNFVGALLDPESTGLKRSHQRRVSRQNA